MSDQNGVIYALSSNGDLTWYRHSGRNDGSANWTSGAKKVGHGWNFRRVFYGGDGVIYAITDNGDLLWYRHDGRNDGSGRWTFSEGKKIGHGWDFKQVFYGGDSIIYAITTAGDLYWYRHDGRNDGSDRWASGGRKIGHGWDFKQVFYGGDGIIYAITDTGDLYWYRHDGRNDGSDQWASGGKKIGHGWDFKQVFAAGDGVIYAITPITNNPVALVGGDQQMGGDLLWFRHDGRNDGSATWASGAKTVGHGWGSFTTAFCGDGGYRVYGAIGDKYTQLGGSDSWLGWPTSDEQDFVEGGRVNTFEHGNIYWWPDTGAREVGDVVVQYTGLHCFGETDIDGFSSHDEPYATIGVAGPHGITGTFRSQIYQGVDSGEECVEIIEIYRGKPQGLVISTILQEYSGGDTEISRTAVKEIVEKGGTALAASATLIPVVGPVLGPLATAGYQLIREDIIGALNDFIENTLGFADRPLGTDLREITPKQMIVLATRPEGNAQFGAIPWRLETDLLSRFGASYKVYFTIQTA